MSRRRERAARRPAVFAVVGAIAMVASIAAFAAARAAGASGVLATVTRLAIALPILYLGYARFLLGDVRIRDRREHGALGAELRMIARVAGAVAASFLAKLALEPLLVGLLAGHDGAISPSHMSYLIPLIGDLGYGPLVSYLALTLVARQQ